MLRMPLQGRRAAAHGRRHRDARGRGGLPGDGDATLGDARQRVGPSIAIAGELGRCMYVCYQYISI